MRYIIIIFFLYNLDSYSQNIEIGYIENIKQENNPESTTIERRLEITGRKSIYSLISSSVNKELKSKNTSIFKDLKNNLVYSNLSFLSLDMNIQDNLTHLFNWELKDGQKEILGYQCKRATVLFRGREFEAWYTTAIPVQNGPYKFHGLPGLILEVKTTQKGNDVYKYHVVSNTISINKFIEPFNNPFQGQTYTWEDFRVKYENLYNKLINYKGVDGNTTISMSKGGVELFINED